MSTSVEWNLCRVCNNPTVAKDSVELSDGTVHHECYQDLTDKAGVSTCERCEMATDIISDEAICYAGGCDNAHVYSFTELTKMTYPEAGSVFVG